MKIYHHLFGGFAVALAVPAFCAVAFAQEQATPPAIGYTDSFQTNYLVPGVTLEATMVRVTNAGSHTLTSLTLFGQPPVGSADICASFYTFPQGGGGTNLLTCCSCKVPANDFLPFTTGSLYPPNQGHYPDATVKLLASVAPALPATCDPTVVPVGVGTPGGFASGVRATAIHHEFVNQNVHPTETRFEPVSLGSNEINKIVNQCKALPVASRCTCVP